MTIVAVKKPGKSWERHYVSRSQLKGFLGHLNRQGVLYRMASP